MGAPVLLPPNILYKRKSATMPATMPSWMRALPLPLATLRANRVEVLPSEVLNWSNVLLCVKYRLC